MPKHSTNESRDRLKIQHSHRVPDENTIKVLRTIRQQFLNLSVFIDDQLPNSRERSLCLTALEEARMWACNAATSGPGFTVREDLTVNIPAEH